MPDDVQDVDEDFTPSTADEILNSIGEGDEPAVSEEDGEAGAAPQNGNEAPAADTNGNEGVVGGTPAKSPDGKANGPQDLVDANGAVVATGGRERRFYESAQKFKGQADNLSRENSTLKAQIEGFEKAGTVGAQLNLTPEEVTAGAQLVANWKDDPMSTLKMMLTQAQALGHDVSSVVDGGGGMNPQAVKQMLDEALRPLTASHERDADTQRVNEQAQGIYNDFIGRFPDVRIHEDTISKMIENDRSLSLDAAYYKLQTFFAQRGLDWNQSLATHEAAQNSASPASAPTNTLPQPPDGGGVPQIVTDTPASASADASSDEIIRAAMVEAGI